MPSMLSDIARNIAPLRRNRLGVEVGEPRMGPTVEVGTPTMNRLGIEVGEPETERPRYAVEVGEPEMAEEGPTRVASAKPKGRKRKQQAQWQDHKYLDDVGSRLASKAVTGAGIPAEGMVPMAQLPKQYTEMVVQAAGAPVVGWAPGELEPDEAELLFKLMAAAQQGGRETGGV